MANYYLRADGTAANLAAAVGPDTDATKCMSMATHNAASIVAGSGVVVSDKGGDFTAGMVLPSDGSNGSPIAYTPIGSPTINLLNTVAGPWTAGGSTGSTWSATYASGTSQSGVNKRRIIASAMATGTQVRVKFKFTGTGTISGAAIGVRSGTTGNFTAPPTRITFGGANTYTASGAEEKWSDWIDFSFDHTVSHLVSYYLHSASNVGEDGTADLEYGNDTDTDDSQNQNGSGLTLRAFNHFVSGIEVNTPSSAYSAALTTSPKGVWWTTPGSVVTQLAKNAGAGSGVSSNQWDWSSNTLYVNIGKDPSTETIEASKPGTGIDLNGKSYINMTGLTVKGGELADDGQSAGGGVHVYYPSTNVNLTNMTATKAYGEGFRILGANYVTLDTFTVSNIYGNAPSPGTCGDGVQVTWFSPAGEERTPTNITVKNGTIAAAINRQGIACLDADTVTIQGNSITDSQNAIDLEPNPGTNQGVTNATVQNNTVNISRSGVYGLTISEPTSSNVLFLNNTVDLNNSSSSTGGISWADGATGPSDITFRGNTFRNCTIGLRMAKTGTGRVIDRNYFVAGSAPSYAIDITVPTVAVTANLLTGAWATGIYVEDAGIVTIYNNTIYGAVVGIGTTNSASTVTPKNNIISGSTTRHVQKAAAVIWVSDNNDFYPNTGTLFNWGGNNYNFADWKTNSSQDGSSIVTDPRFTDAAGGNFRLLPGSPCIGKALRAALSTTDYEGSSWLTADIGAYRSLQLLVLIFKKRRR